MDDAYLIKTLRDYHGLTYQDIGWRLGRSKSWVGRRLGLITDLPRWLQDLIRDGILQCSAAEKYILPLSRSNDSDAKALVKNIRGLHLSAREIGELYCAWREGDAAGRNLVIHQPCVVLKARQVAENDPKNLKISLLNDMEFVLSLSRRINQSWDQFPVSYWDLLEIQQIMETGEMIRRNLEELYKKIRSESLSNERRKSKTVDSEAT